MTNELLKSRKVDFKLDPYTYGLLQELSRSHYTTISSELCQAISFWLKWNKEVNELRLKKMQEKIS